MGLYELFVLGELMDRSMHGYMLHSILNKVIGPLQKISWGVLYPLIHGLEEDGLIEQVHEEDAQQKGRGRKKKTYRITPEGRRRFYRLMEEPIEYKPAYEIHFQIKMSNFDQVDQQLKRIILYQYRDFLKFLQRHIEENTADILKNKKFIPPGELKDLLNLNHHRLDKLRVDQTWVDEGIESITDNGGSKNGIK